MWLINHIPLWRRYNLGKINSEATQFVRRTIKRASEKTMDEEHSWFTKELHDTSWIGVQKNTFTNWCNDRLKATGVRKVSDLEVDLQDGLTLIQLLEILSHRKKLPGR